MTDDHHFIPCSDSNNIYNLSLLCLNPTNVNLECVSNLSRFDSDDTSYDLTYALRISVGVWCILVAIVGIFGNLLTLFALPYDYKRRYRNVSNSETWNTSTIFIINLARIDLVFCIFCMPTFIFPLLTQRPLDAQLCRGKIPFRLLSDILRYILL